MPKISVVMPVYNGGKYLCEAIDSILNQSFKDFEFIIVNDGSKDKTEEIIKSYKDERIIYVKNTSNKGLSASFNIGIRIARGAYIARMDADDVSIYERFSTQLSFLESHAEIGIVGSSAILIDKDGRFLKKYYRPVRHMEIKWASLFSTPLIHPTVMARAEVLKENPYDETMTSSEDYELWSRLLFERSVIFANIPEPLLYYRVFQESFTQGLNNDKRATSARNSINNIERYITLSEEEKDMLTELREDLPLSSSQLLAIWNLYKRAAGGFVERENISFPKNLTIYSRLSNLALFLLKHKLKHISRPV
ncbi:MAG: glycosyltransferase [Patescibacteria group bacterium]